MATIILGGLVTDIAGSIGGTTFRRFPGGHVLSNKTRGASSNRLLLNPRLTQLSFIFQSWRGLSSGDKSDWADIASTITVPDKFGNPKYLSARQFFTKVQSQALVIGTYPVVPVSFTTDLYPFTPISFQIDTGGEVVGLAVTASGEVLWYTVQLEVTRGVLRSPTFSRRKVIYSTSQDVTFTVDFWNELMANFPWFDNTCSCRAYVTVYNVAGWKGSTLTIDAVVV